jgi:hypothetical protein
VCRGCHPQGVTGISRCSCGRSSKEGNGDSVTDSGNGKGGAIRVMVVVVLL